MKYVQAGILACLVIIAGLLFGIYQGQRADSVAASEAVPQMEEPGLEAALQPVELDKTEPATQPEPASDKPPVAQAKPRPLPPAPPVRRPAKPAPRPSPPAVEPAPVDEPAEPEQTAAPPPVIEPVIPNLPPLLDTPETEPPPPLPQTVVLPDRSEIVVRLVNTLSTNRNRPGDRFEATLEEPLQVDGWLVAAKGSTVEGQVLESKEAGRVKGVAELSFHLVSLTTAEGETVDISTAALGEAGEKSRGEDLKKIGWGAGIGAIIGAIAGGGKGAAIGAGAGAGAGAGTVIATRGKTLVVPTETRLSFRLTQPLEVTTTKKVDR